MNSSEQLPPGWKELPFAEAVDFQEGPGILAKDFREAGIPLIRLAGLERGTPLLTGCNFLDEAVVAQRWAHFRVAEGDVLLSTSASLGRVAIVDPSAAGAIPYTGIIRMRPKRNDLLPTFIPFLLQSPHFQQQVEMMGVGSVIRHFGPSHLRRMSVVLPDPATQSRIASILGALDDKIELNRRMNQTLEEMAQAIFKSWFVDFEGHTEFEESELGRIPKGWRADALSSVLALLTDGAHHSPPSVEDGRPMASSKDLTPFGVDMSSCRLISEEDFEALARGGCKPRRGDVLLAKDGARCLETACEYQQDDEVVLLSSVAILRPTSIQWSCFLDVWLGLKATRQYLREGFVSGSAIPRIVLKDLRRARLVVPPEDVLLNFDNLCRPLKERSRQNQSESSTLAALRDTLLPKLISGEIRVREAEKLVENVA